MGFLKREMGWPCQEVAAVRECSTPSLVPFLLCPVTQSRASQSACHQKEIKSRWGLGCQGTDGHSTVGPGARDSITMQKLYFL